MPQSRKRKKKKATVQFVPKRILLTGADSNGDPITTNVKTGETKRIKHVPVPSNQGWSPKKEKPFKVDKAHIALLYSTMGVRTGRIKSS